jgi:hypothetical protein
VWIDGPRDLIAARIVTMRLGTLQRTHREGRTPEWRLGLDIALWLWRELGALLAFVDGKSYRSGGHNISLVFAT